jgi:hypothetical protein
MIKLTSKLYSLLSLIFAISIGSLSVILLAPIREAGLIGETFVIVISLSIVLIYLAILEMLPNKTITLTSKKLTRLVQLIFVTFLGISILSTILRISEYTSHWLIEFPKLFIWLFFPGFFILGLLDKNGEIPFLLRVIVSYLLSALIVVLLATSFSMIFKDF